MIQFLLPEHCETCNSKCIERRMSHRFSGSESAEYECGARYDQYLSHQTKRIERACPNSPGEIQKAARIEKIDRAVAAALNKVGATYQECVDFPKRMERDKGWSLRRAEGVWTFIHAKRPEED